MRKLDPNIIDFLAKKLKINPKTVRKNIYLLVKNYPNLTKNAVAQIYARKKGLTIFRKLDKKDRVTLPSSEVIPEKIKIKQTRATKKSIKILINYDSDDYFRKGHVDELNKAYTYGCYTAVFILARKIVENLTIDILKAKFPEKKKENKELYFDTQQKRFKDFGVILTNLKNKKDNFGSDNKAVERLYNLAIKLKKDANDKTHSWFHLVRKPEEIRNLELETIIEIIKKLEKAVGIRK